MAHCSWQCQVSAHPALLLNGLPVSTLANNPNHLLQLERVTSCKQVPVIAQNPPMAPYCPQDTTQGLRPAVPSLPPGGSVGLPLWLAPQIPFSSVDSSYTDSCALPVLPCAFAYAVPSAEFPQVSELSSNSDPSTEAGPWGRSRARLLTGSALALG